MNPSDIYAVLQWWIILFILGGAFLPLTIRLFDKFFDKGYIFSKLIGIIITGYCVFALGVMHIAPFTTGAITAILLLVALLTFILLPDKWKLLYVLKRFWLIFAIEEILFLTILIIWSYVHSFAPDIHGLEKYMDFGFINSFLRSEYLPAKDMWFTPYFINYYYFGHLLTAMLTKLAGLSSAITFNLMLSSIVAFCFTQSFSIGANLFCYIQKNGTLNKIKLILSGLLTAFLVTFAGNLHIFYTFFKPYKNDEPLPFWQLQFLPNTFPNQYWYPNATRFIHNTIHEFPIYSWVVADLHGHVLDIPFVLLTIALFLSFILHQQAQEPENEKTLKRTFQVNPLLLIFSGLLLACMYMTNAWDGAIYLLLAALVLLFIFGQKIPLYKKYLGQEDEDDVKVIKKSTSTRRFQLPVRWKMIWARDYIVAILVIIAAFFVFTTPYNIHFKPFVSGIGILCAPDFLTHIGKLGPLLFEPEHCQKSPWWQLLSLYGFFYFFVTIFLIWVLKSKKHSATDIFVLLLIILSTLLIIIPEFIYVKDIYPAHYRANTMFKLAFQAFIMLSISSSYIIIRSFSKISDLPWGKKLLAFCYVLTTTALVYLVMTYPYLAIKSYYNDFKNYQGLNGTAYLKSLYPSDYAGLVWLNDHVKGQPVILEAQGDSYTDYARVSTNTGLPTVLGWTVHEWLWRGSYNIPAPRIEEVKKMYESADATATKKLLQKYKVEYVFIGNQEYLKYPTLNEQKFRLLGKLVFMNGTTKIYQLNK